MSFKDVTAGDKVGQATHARFVEAKTGAIGLEIAFKFKQGEAEERLTWVAWLTPAAIQFSMETLKNVLGFNGNDSADANGALTDPAALAYGQDVRLVVELEPYTDKNGQAKTSPKIKFVNKLGGSNFAGVAPETIKSKLASIGLKAAFLAAGGIVAPSPQLPEADLPF